MFPNVMKVSILKINFQDRLSDVEIPILAAAKAKIFSKHPTIFYFILLFRTSNASSLSK